VEPSLEKKNRGRDAGHIKENLLKDFCDFYVSSYKEQ
jgi:hypothetical protein